MGLLEEIRAEAMPKGPSCSVGSWLLNADEDDRRQLAEALADRSIAATAIHRVLRRRGAAFNAESLQRHRRGTCKCQVS